MDGQSMNHIFWKNTGILSYVKSSTVGRCVLVACVQNTCTLNTLKIPACLDVMQNHPLHRMHFDQYQAPSAALEWLGDGECYLMHKMQSLSFCWGGWGLYSLRKLTRYPYIYEACICVSPALDGSSTIEHFKCGNVIETCNKVIFNLCTGRMPVRQLNCDKVSPPLVPCCFYSNTVCYMIATWSIAW